MATDKEQAIAEAIRFTLVSPNVSDSNGEAANVVDALNEIARALFYIGRVMDEAKHDKS